jgi:biotin operon repressor
MWNTDLLKSVSENFNVNFVIKRVPSRQTIHKLVNKLRTTGLLINKKQKHKHQVLTEKLGDIGARLEHMPRKSLKHLAQETGMSKSSARRATQLLKLRPYKTTVIHTRLQSCDPASSAHFSSWFLHSVVEVEIDPQLTFFSDEVCFHLQGYTNTQNNRYWSS